MENKLANYFEHIARIATAIGHTDTECHFSFLEDDKDIKLADVLHYPCLHFADLQYTYSGQPGAMFRTHRCMIAILDHVDDTGNTPLIEATIARMERTADNIFGRILSDSRKQEYSYLSGIEIINVTVEPIQNQDDALYGCRVAFTYKETWCGVPDKEAFNDELDS